MLFEATLRVVVHVKSCTLNLESPSEAPPVAEGDAMGQSCSSGVPVAPMTENNDPGTPVVATHEAVPYAPVKPPVVTAPGDEELLRQRKRDFVKALKAGDLPSVIRCLEAGVSVDERSMWDNTPLIIACHYGHAAVAIELLKCGADAAAVNEQGCTPLLYCCVEGLTEVVDIILASYAATGALLDLPAAPVYSRRRDQTARRTPLAAAAENGFLPVVRRLLALNVQPSHEALQCAAAHGEAEVVTALLDALQSGAATASSAALRVAVRGAHMDTVRALLAAAPATADALRAAVEIPSTKSTERESLVALLCRAGAPANELGSDGLAPLHLAARSGSDAEAQALLSHGADPGLLTGAGETPANIARNYGHAKLGECLATAARALQAEQSLAAPDPGRQPWCEPGGELAYMAVNPQTGAEERVASGQGQGDGVETAGKSTPPASAKAIEVPGGLSPEFLLGVDSGGRPRS